MAETKEHTKTLTLQEHEAKGLVDGSVTMLWRPCPRVHESERKPGVYLKLRGRAGMRTVYDTNERREDVVKDGRVVSSRDYALPLETWLAGFTPFKARSVIACRETWGEADKAAVILGSGEPHEGTRLAYRASERDRSICRWRSATSMPRWAVRTHLRVVSVVCKRVQDVTEEEAKAWGCICDSAAAWGGGGFDGTSEGPYRWAVNHGHRADFANRWRKLYPSHPVEHFAFGFTVEPIASPALAVAAASVKEGE